MELLPLYGDTSSGCLLWWWDLNLQPGVLEWDALYCMSHNQYPTFMWNSGTPCHLVHSLHIVMCEMFICNELLRIEPESNKQEEPRVGPKVKKLWCYNSACRQTYKPTNSTTATSKCDVTLYVDEIQLVCWVIFFDKRKSLLRSIKNDPLKIGGHLVFSSAFDLGFCKTGASSQSGKPPLLTFRCLCAREQCKLKNSMLRSTVFLSFSLSFTNTHTHSLSHFCERGS